MKKHPLQMKSLCRDCSEDYSSSGSDEKCAVGGQSRAAGKFLCRLQQRSATAKDWILRLGSSTVPHYLPKEEHGEIY